MMVMEQEEARKGPWTEQEDLQLAYFVRIFGQRRWEFIAKVSGLKRTGKSCRLRWVNYLHPDLKRGRMTPQEERIVLELHSKWGNRWSRIARKLPGRTDNEIKNYWRTHMRRKAQEKDWSLSSSPSSSSSMNCGALETLGKSHVVVREVNEKGTNGYSMDEIWKEIGSIEEVESKEDNEECEEGCSFSCPSMASPLWVESLWGANDEEIKIL